MQQNSLSLHPERNTLYRSLLKKAHFQQLTVAELIRTGTRCMRQAKLHPHFFKDRSLLTTARYLTFFSLQFPHEYQNKQYLNATLSEAQTLKIINLFERRIEERIPAEYITQECQYGDNTFFVNKNVLVPRSVMNTRFSDFLKEIHWKNYRVLDLCCGSGCIGITLALMHPKISVDLVDISESALEVASINVKIFSLSHRVFCIQSNLFENIHSQYDFIITNPPYVADYEYLAQPLEVKHEPSIALKAGKDGLAIIKKIIEQSKAHLNPEGSLCAEVGYSAATLLKKKYPKIPFKWLKYRAPTGKKSFLDWLIQKTGYLDSHFLCQAKDLP